MIDSGRGPRIISSDRRLDHHAERRRQRGPVHRNELAALRRGVCRGGRRAARDAHRARMQRTLDFARHADVARLSQQGPATPDHVIRTKRVPMLGSDVAAYARGYRAISASTRPHAKEPRPCSIRRRAWCSIQDSACARLGRTRGRRDRRGTVRAHDRRDPARRRARAAGRRCPARDIFDVEYWDLEQAKLKKGRHAAGVCRRGRAGHRRRLRHRQGLRRRPAPPRRRGRRARSRRRRSKDCMPGADFLGVRCDVTDAHAIEAALDAGRARLRRPRHAGAERRHIRPPRARSANSPTRNGAASWASTSTRPAPDAPLPSAAASSRPGRAAWW